MTEDASPGERASGSAPPSRPPEEDLEELRRLLGGEDRRTLHRLHERLDDPQLRAQDVSRVLPDAIRLRTAQDDRLAVSLSDTIDDSLRDSVRRDPQGIADALFPVMGPAIRKAIADTIGRMVQSLNKTLEQSLSPKAIKWRFEAWRTGKPFAEVVLLHTLLYRVEQVFLIHGETGLLLRHVAADAVDVRDGDVISGMLTAIQDFVRDSFGDGGEDTLDAMEVGDLTVWVERGPHAVLAAVIRGEAPLDLRTEMQAALEAIHRAKARDLEAFRGDDTPFASVEPDLERCLQVAERERGRRRGPVLAIGALVLVLAGLGWWIVSGANERSDWDAVKAALHAKPGIVIVSEEREHGKRVAVGLRDPLAADGRATLEALLDEHGLDGDDYDIRLFDYVSVEDEIVQERAEALLGPPVGVEARVRDGALTLQGEATHAWIERALQRAPVIAGVRTVDAQGLRATDADAVLLARLRAALHPPPGVRLTAVAGGARAVGEASTRWIRDARVLALGVPGVLSFETSGLVATDADALAVEAARRLLDPPAGVHLSVADGLLVARGEAPGAWIDAARLLGRAVPGVRRLDLGGLRASDADAVLLARAASVLRPPATVNLTVDDGVLTATGSAPARWIEDVRILARTLVGARRFDAAGVSPSDADANLLAEARRVLRPPAGVSLSARDGRLVAAGAAPQAWIDAARLLARTLAAVAFDTEDLRILDRDALLLEEARRVLQPPTTVRLRVDDAVLHLSGAARHAWVLFAREAARGIEGLAAFRDDDLRDLDQAALAAAVRSLESRVVLFERNRAVPLPGQAVVFDAAAGDVGRVIEAARVVGRTAVVELVGQTDSSAARDRAETLARERAEVVRGALVSRTVAAAALRVAVTGPASGGRTPAERARQRRVSFRVVTSEGDK